MNRNAFSLLFLGLTACACFLWFATRPSTASKALKVGGSHEAASGFAVGEANANPESSNSLQSSEASHEKSAPPPPSEGGQTDVFGQLLTLVDSENRILPKTLPPANPAHYDALLDEFRRAEDLSRKQRLAWVLAYIGDERAVDVLTNALLTIATERRELPVQEAQELGGMAFAVGILARRHDSAFDFLVRGSNPGFWDSSAGGDVGDRRTATILTGSCLRGLARSQRSEVPAIFAGVRTNSAPKIARALASSLVDSAFIWSMQQQHGDAWDNGEIYRNGEEYMRLFVQWGQTPEGRGWRRWSQNVRGIPDRMIDPRSRP